MSRSRSAPALDARDARRSRRAPGDVIAHHGEHLGGHQGRDELLEAQIREILATKQRSSARDTCG